MSDMNRVIIPKSDQLNADDLIAGPRTIKITGVKFTSSEQPISVFFEGDNGKPWKPCKSMCRVLVRAWGNESKNYTGRSLTIYRDDKVKWAGLAVGGIRISHMSHLDKELTMALTETKGSRKTFTVKALAAQDDIVPTGNTDALRAEANDAAEHGKDALQAFWNRITKEDRKTLADDLAGLKTKAEAADESAKTAETADTGERFLTAG